MSVKFRLQRWGSKKKPFYYIVVADSRKARDGRILEKIGTYDPNKNPSAINLKEERVKYWYGVGARPSDTVKKIFKIENVEL